jgi:hypothetical protein
MGRIAFLIAVLCTVLWQSGDLARTTATGLGDLAHAALHWHEKGHHHLEDGSIQLDDSTESVLHVLGDPATASPALLTRPRHDLAPLASSAPGGLHERLGPAPTLDGLLRPPRSRA